ncbi:SURP and G-patch domain-containing protein 1-like protein [Hibiscus syriacus]|uniref:SURP and G-patch domain-containing protein 1-like protein n=1 Tax=Hibiscus syriacus TaxID=106335 RepID=A0A6A3ABY3_HIBSY|nr:SURP and G-patch domain-containing protein 1-like protein [Hibiscus syriacus]
MEKGMPSSLFVNDGSFMERFKQLQQQKYDKDKAAALEESKPPNVVRESSAVELFVAFNKVASERKTAQTPGGKLAFSLKRKSKLVAPPVKLDADDDEEDQDAGNLYLNYQSTLVEKALSQRTRNNKLLKVLPSPQAALLGLFHTNEVIKHLPVLCMIVMSLDLPWEEQFCLPDVLYMLFCGGGSSTAPSGADPSAMMEFYMKKAAQEEKMRMPKQSKDEMPPPPSLQALAKKGHHMGEYIPQDELEKFLAACNAAAAQKSFKGDCAEGKDPI